MSFAKFGATCVALSLFAVSANAGSHIWNEQGDAGDLPATAQDVDNGGGQLSNIIGASFDGVDMYGIVITDPNGFSAWTSGDQGGAGGSADFDTQLYLFDSAGMGVLGNDDNPGGAPFHSGITVPANDGTGAAPAGPGNYYIAVSNFGNSPVSAGGQIFDQASFEEISGPDGPGGNSAITGWEGGAGGNYDIFLTGAAGVPEPATLGLLGIGALAMIRRRRAA